TGGTQENLINFQNKINSMTIGYGRCCLSVYNLSLGSNHKRDGHTHKQTNRHTHVRTQSNTQSNTHTHTHTLTPLHCLPHFTPSHS
uniref:Uncharacterized protein n=1 Tax=Salarias fasciatus TaxID=181472 RepID=A0A672HHV9_SALFA